MARFGKKKDKELDDIGKLIIAEWLRVVPDDSGNVGKIDTVALTAALNNLIDVPCQAVADEKNLVHIVIPYPPKETRTELEEYLNKNGNFKKEMTEATLFGCGR